MIFYVSNSEGAVRDRNRPAWTTKHLSCHADVSFTHMCELNLFLIICSDIINQFVLRLLTLFTF